MNTIHTNMPMTEYRAAKGLANSELQMFVNDPATYIWSKNAPRDPKKATTAEVGTALHTELLEPHLFDDEIIVASVKGRTTKAFEKDQADNPDKIVLTQEEVEKIKTMGLSAKAHPTFKKYLDMPGDAECSIFVTCPETGLRLKIRPDKVFNPGATPTLFADVKSTASIDEWRSDKEWLNPLYKYGYGFTAAYYLYVGSIFYGVEMTDYKFLIVQSTASFGAYPVTVFNISKRELVDMGFWDEMLNAVRQFKIVSDANEWETEESFYINGVSDDMVIKFEGDK